MTCRDHARGQWQGGRGRGPAALALTKTGLFLSLTAFAVLSAPSLHAWSLWLSHPLDVMTITDMKPDGKKFPVPTKKQPIYYEAINAGFNDFGRAIGGDKAPNEKLMQDTVVRALSRNHYLSANKKHDATEIIVMTWGTLYGGSGLSVGPPGTLRFLAGDKYMDGGDESEEKGFMSVEHIGRRIIPALGQTKLHDYAQSDLYLVLLRAYSTREANAGKIVELWETRIVVPSNGLALDASLPAMVQLAAPHIGVDMKEAVFTTPEQSMHEDIQTGEIKVVDDVDVNAAHVTPISDLIKEAASQRAGNPGTKPDPGADKPLKFEPSAKPAP